MHKCENCKSAIVSGGISRNNKIYCGLDCLYKDKGISMYKRKKAYRIKVCRVFKKLVNIFWLLAPLYFAKIIYLLYSGKEIEKMLYLAAAIGSFFILMGAFFLANIYAAIKWGFIIFKSRVEIKKSEPISYYIALFFSAFLLICSVVVSYFVIWALIKA